MTNAGKIYCVVTQLKNGGVRIVAGIDPQIENLFLRKRLAALEGRPPMRLDAFAVEFDRQLFCALQRFVGREISPKLIEEITAEAGLVLTEVEREFA